MAIVILVVHALFFRNDGGLLLFVLVLPSSTLSFSYNDQQPTNTSTTTISNDNTAVSTMTPTEEEEIQSEPRDPYLPLPHDITKPYSWETETILQQQQSKQQLLRPLNFVHIPKTGGTSIVMAAANANYAWADCLFYERRQRKNCPPPQNATNFPSSSSSSSSNNDNNNNPYFPQRWKHSIRHHPYMNSWWHVPLQYLPTNDDNNDHDDDVPSPYINQDLFAVVRNPYQRAVSQYYYRCTRVQKEACYLLIQQQQQQQGGKQQIINIINTTKDTPETMNAYLQAMLYKQKRAPPNSPAYFFEDGHWIPQAHYIYNVTVTNTSKEEERLSNNATITTAASYYEQRRLVQHVVHLEYLSEHFPALMQAYYSTTTTNTTIIQLPQEKMLDRHKTYPTTACSVHNLTTQTMRLIEDVYWMDFTLLGDGYPMLSHNY